jgi:hypothetical protein
VKPIDVFADVQYLDATNFAFGLPLSVSIFGLVKSD